MIRKIFWSKYSIIGVFTLILGLIIGILITDFPYIEFDRKLEIYEILNLLITISIAISIPFIVKKSIDDKRAIKAFLSEEIKSSLVHLSKIKELIVSCYIAKAITRNDKDDIIRLFNNLEMQINSLSEQLNVSFKTQSNQMIKDIKEEYFAYDGFVTNDDLMCESYTIIDSGFYRDQKVSYCKLELKLKKPILEIIFY